MPILLLLLACAEPAVDSAPPEPPATAHWMGDTFQGDADIPLGQLLLPAAFNSSSYACAEEHGMSPDAPEAVRAIWGDDPGDPDNRARVVGWSRTQDRPIAQQLEDGLRFVEINVTLKDGVVTTWHSVYGVPVGELLDELVAFSLAWPEEVVVVHFGVSIDPADHGLLVDALVQPRVDGVSFCDRVYTGAEAAATTPLSAVWASGESLIWSPQGDLRALVESRGDCALSAGDSDRAWSITVSPEGVEEALAGSVVDRDPERFLINDFVFSLSGADSPLQQAAYIAEYSGVQEASVALGFAGDLPARLIGAYDAEQQMNIFAGAYYQDTELVEAAIAANAGR